MTKAINSEISACTSTHCEPSNNKLFCVSIQRPFGKYTLFQGEIFGRYYGLNSIRFIYDEKRRATPSFQTKEELKFYLETKGYVVTFTNQKQEKQEM